MLSIKQSGRRLLVIFVILMGLTMQTALAKSKPNKLIHHFPVRMLEGDWEMVGFYSRTLDVSKVPTHPSYWDEDTYFPLGTRLRFTFSKDQDGYFDDTIAVYRMTFLKPYPRLFCEYSFYNYVCNGSPDASLHIELGVDPINPKEWKLDQYEYAPVEIPARFVYFLGGTPQGTKINEHVIFESKDKFYMEQNFYAQPAKNIKERLDKDIKIAGTVGLIFKRIK